MRILLDLILTALVLLFVAEFMPGISVGGLTAAIVFALVLGLINLLIKPVLKILTFPISVITLGLFSFILNAFLFWLAASLVETVSISSFGSAFVAALLVSLITTLAHKVTG